MTKVDVLKVAGEPFGFITTDHAGCEVFTKTRFKLKGHDQFSIYTESQLLAVAAAMYAKGAEDMRERASALCKEHAFGWSTYKDHQGHAFAADNCATTIRALPITTNTEGEQDGH